jgi:Ca2+-binding EF-hand superfamily protein
MPEAEAQEIEASQQELEEAFKLFDIDGDGKITTEELKGLVEKVGGSMSDAEAAGLIKKADRDGNGIIDFEEFSRLWSAIRGDGEDLVKEEFTKLDADNSGYITKEEMLAVISNCEHFTGDKADEAKKCIEELDVDKDGKVSYPEFLLVWRYKK